MKLQFLSIFLVLLLALWTVEEVKARPSDIDDNTLIDVCAGYDDIIEKDCKWYPRCYWDHNTKKCLIKKRPSDIDDIDLCNGKDDITFDQCSYYTYCVWDDNIKKCIAEEMNIIG